MLQPPDQRGRLKEGGILVPEGAYRQYPECGEDTAVYRNPPGPPGGSAESGRTACEEAGRDIPVQPVKDSAV